MKKLPKRKDCGGCVSKAITMRNLANEIERLCRNADDDERMLLAQRERLIRLTRIMGAAEALIDELQACSISPITESHRITYDLTGEGWVRVKPMARVFTASRALSWMISELETDTALPLKVRP